MNSIGYRLEVETQGAANRMSAYRRLADGLPDRKAGSADGMPTDARAARDFVAGLPLADRAETSRRLLAAIDGLNGLKLDASNRLAVLEALRGQIADMLSYVEQQILGSSFPLPSSKSELGHLAQAFHAALALGYRLVVVDLCAPSGSIRFLRGKSVLLALERALYHNAAALAASYLVYLKPAPGIWASLHDLARFADDAGLADKPVADAMAGRDVRPSLLYRQAVLIAICNPYRFAQREQIDLTAASYALGALCRVQKLPQAGAFLLAEGEDHGPGYLPSERKEQEASGWSFDLAPLRAEIEKQANGGAEEIVLRAPGGVQGRLSVDMAQRCMSAWGSTAERNHPRLTAGHHLDSIIGLSALHFYLAGEKDFESFMRQVHGAGASLAAGTAATWTGNPGEQSRPGVFRTKVLDQSLGGYQLEWDKRHAVRARVGELVGLAVPSDGAAERDWMLAIIRWLRYDPDGGLDAGVELLARRARAVGLRPPNGRDTVRAALRGIEFRHVRDGGDEALHVLAPAIVERHVGVLEVTRGIDPTEFDGETTVTWLSDMRMVEHTGDYLHLTGSLGDNGPPGSESKSS
jgi:cyclic-di-GMP-binding protein